MSNIDLRAAIEDSDLPNKEALAGVVRTGILALGNQVADSPAIGSSRIGGRPDVPADFAWPMWEADGDSVPLSFVAQINLAELPDCPDRSLLPADGLLSFFYVCHFDLYDGVICGHDDEEFGAFRVFHFPSTDNLVRHDQKPDALTTIEADWGQEVEGFYFPAIPLRFETCQTIPDGEHPVMKTVGYNYLENGFDAHNQFQAVIEAAGYTRGVSPEGYGHNQILGYPNPIQTSVCYDMETATSEEFDKEHEMSWELLLQLDTQDDVNDMMWGDCGRIYFMIPREDLLARRWEKAHLIMQGS